MSFDNYQGIIEAGDTVVLYITINEIYNVEAKPKITNKKGKEVDNVFQTPYGALKCAELIGTPYGSKVQLSKGWGYVLQPNPELWTITLPHRTQIIYTPDVSMIILQLEIQPGSTVIESGTGSGSLSHALIRAVKPHGHLYTFDFHEARANAARDEFKAHGIDKYVTVSQRDVCSSGFGEDLCAKADAVFLDLPHPWLAIPHVVRSFKNTGGRFCSFSPCIEQVQKSCEALLKHNFQEIETLEVIQQEFSVQIKPMPVLDLEFLKTERKEVAEQKNKLEKQKIKFTTSVPLKTYPGHTGYLTFATLPPIWTRSLQISVNEETFTNNDLLNSDPRGFNSATENSCDI